MSNKYPGQIILIIYVSLLWFFIGGPTHTLAAVRPEYGGTMTICLSRNDISIDPLQIDNIEAFWIGRHVFEPLFCNKNGEIIGNYARTWSLSEDKTILSIFLHQGLVFSNAKPLTAVDVKLSLERATLFQADAQLGCPLLNLKGCNDFITDAKQEIMGIIVRSETELELHFENPQPSIVRELCHIRYSILPDGIYDNRQPVGNGPFRLKEKPNRSKTIIIENNPLYYRGNPYLDEVVFQLGCPPYKAAQLFERDKIDLFFQLFGEWQTLQGFSESGLFQSETLEPACLLFLDLNTDRAVLKSEHFRKRLNDLIDRQSIFRILLKKQGTIAQAFIGPKFSPYYEIHSLSENFDQSNESETSKNPDQQKNTLVLLVPSDFPVIENIAGRIQVNLLDSDIAVSLRKMPNENIEDLVQKGDYDCAIRLFFFQETQPDLMLREFMTVMLDPPISSRFSLYKPIIDKFLYLHNIKNSSTEGFTELFRIEQDLLRTMTILPLFFPRFILLEQKDICGLSVTRNGFLVLENTWFFPNYLDNQPVK